MEDGVKHEDKEREPVQTCQRGGKPLIVFGEPAEADGPSEGTLDHPPPGQKDHAWKRKFGGMEVSEAKRLRAMEEENSRLKRLVADQAVQIHILKEVNAKKW